MCCKCNEIEYKENKPLRNFANKSKTLQRKSNKPSNLERNRFSILQENCSKCLLCNSTYQLTWHEVLEGRNRRNSMRYGLFLRICLRFHKLKQEDVLFKEHWHKKGQLTFVANYPDLDFVSIFKRNYL